MKQTTMLTWLPCLIGLWMLLCGCAPDTIGSLPPRAAGGSAGGSAGCSAGGSGVYTPDDASCYLAAAAPDQVRWLDGETAVLLAMPDALADWAGAAIIFHAPTRSMLVLDALGDVDPSASLFGSRAGVAALAELAGDAALMADLQQQVRQAQQSAPDGEPAVRLGVAWQDGPTTLFLIAVAGLEATDSRFYCPGQTWTIDAQITEVVADCVAHAPGTPVSRVFLESQSIGGSRERPVRIALDGVPSNEIMVREGQPAEESAIYRAALQQVTNRPLIVRGETAPATDAAADQQLAAAVDPALLQRFVDVNQAAHGLRFLFHGSSAYSVQPTASVARDYLPDGDLAQGCAQFRRDYPGLGGIMTLSRIGINRDGTQALVQLLQECGPDDRLAATYLLEKVGDDWQVANTIAAAVDLPALQPQLAYVQPAMGCGDLFVYRANRARSEYATAWIRVSAFDLAAGPLTLDLAAHGDAIGVRIDVYADSVEKLGEYPYCNDVGPTAVPRSVWQAVSGTVTVTLSGTPHAEPCAGEPYQATVLLEDLVFALGQERVSLSSLSFEAVTVGWCPG